MSSRRESSQMLVRFFDGWFVPIAFGVVTVLICTQLLGFIPGVRAAFDHAEGRFVAVPTSTIPSVDQGRATGQPHIA